MQPESKAGRANRAAPDGTCREEAEKLAAQIAEFPQVCMRQDRLSSHEQFSLSLPDALQNELRRGMESLKSQELPEALALYTSGAGRHGKF